MKKAMIALAGVLTVMMLASCQKEVEIDGDVEKEVTANGYRCKVEGSASYVSGEEDENGKWIAVTDAKAVELVANTGWIGWDHSTNTNKPRYGINVWNEGYFEETAEKKTLNLEGLSANVIEKHGDKYYLVSVEKEVYGWDSERDDSILTELTVTEGSLEGSQFSVEVTNCPLVTKIYSSNNGEESVDCKLLTFKLKFTRY